MKRRPPACESVRQPHALGTPRLYPCGWCCAIHTPSALQGLPEPPPGPGWPAGSYLHQIENEQSVEQEQSP